MSNTDSEEPEEHRHSRRAPSSRSLLFAIPNGQHSPTLSAQTSGNPMIGQHGGAVKSRGEGNPYLHDAEPDVYPERMPDSRG